MISLCLRSASEPNSMNLRYLFVLERTFIEFGSKVERSYNGLRAELFTTYKDKSHLLMRANGIFLFCVEEIFTSELP